jgi:hypothetical protein
VSATSSSDSGVVLGRARTAPRFTASNQLADEKPNASMHSRTL